MGIELLRESEKGRTYQCDGFKLLYRKSGSVSGDNEVNPDEKIYLVVWSASVVIGKQQFDYDAPAYFEIPKQTFHTITAKTDIVMHLVIE